MKGCLHSDRWTQLFWILFYDTVIRLVLITYYKGEKGHAMDSQQYGSVQAFAHCVRADSDQVSFMTKKLPNHHAPNSGNLSTGFLPCAKKHPTFASNM